MEPAWQSRVCTPNEWELKLAEALETVLSKDLQELAQIVDALNTSGSVDPDDRDWTEASFCAEMARLAEGNGLLWHARSGDGSS